MLASRSFFPAALLAVALAAFTALPWRLASRLPQAAAGDELLAVAFGDARATIGNALFHRADLYMHGGVDIECHDAHCHHCHHDHEHQTSDPQPQDSNFSDPIAWVNRHIRAPEIERHLEGAKTVEMMPWFWAAVKSDPHNIDAWTAAWYVAAHAMKDDALAARVLAEAKAKNPRSAELLFTEGQFLFKGGKGDLVAARRAFERARMRLRELCKDDFEALGERDRQVLRACENYLNHLK